MKLIQHNLKTEFEKEIEQYINDITQEQEKNCNEFFFFNEDKEIINSSKFQLKDKILKKSISYPHDKDDKIINNKEEINENLVNKNKNSDKIIIINTEYPLTDKIYKFVIYNKKDFLKDPKQPKNYPDIVNYRCKYYHKNQHISNKFLCNAILKKIKTNNFYKYELKKDHTVECNSYYLENVICDNTIINN